LQKQILKQIFDISDNSNSAQFHLTNWLNQAEGKEIPKLNKFVKLFRAHLDGIIRHFDTHLTSGFMESINSRIQQIKRTAKGFSNVENFKAIIYLNYASLHSKVTHSF
jgi:transposase